MRRGQELEEIDNALSLPGRSIRFIPRLEAAYEAARGVARNRAIKVEAHNTADGPSLQLLYIHRF